MSTLPAPPICGRMGPLHSWAALRHLARVAWLRREMPTYRFDIRDGRTIHDPHGLDLPDDDTARRYAELLAQALGPIVDEYIRLFVDVVDDDGNVLATYEIS